MKRFLLTTLLLLTISPAFAQVKQLYGETRLGYGAAIAGGKYDGAFSADFVNVILEGNIGPNITYYWRQRFTKPFYNQYIPINATDHIWIRWDINERWALQGGKIPIVVGGYEFDDAPIDLYYWGVFADRLPDVYALGGNVIFKINPENTLTAQVTQSPLGFGYSNLFHTALFWTGRFAPWWHTIWSVNWMDDPEHNGFVMTGLGNRFTAGNFAAELDLMYRTSTKVQVLPANYSAILKLEYRLPIVSVFAKGSLDYNKGDIYDVLVSENSCTYIAGGGVEFFPLKNNDLRLHAVAWWDSRVENRANLTFGLTYRLRVVK